MESLYTADGVRRQLYLRLVSYDKMLPEVCCASLLLRELLLSNFVTIITIFDADAGLCMGRLAVV